MKKLLLAVAFFSFLGLTTASACEDGKKCDKKECVNKKGADAKKECSSKDAKKGCCAKGKETADKKEACTHDKTAATGKSCCAAKVKTEEKKGE